MLLCLSFWTSAQNIFGSEQEKLSIGLFFSPDYAFRSLEADSDTSFTLNLRNDTEIPKFGFTAGVRMNYHVTERLIFETGFLLSEKGEKTKFQTLTTQVPEPDLPDEFRIVYRYYYLDIPWKVNYTFPIGRTIIFLSGGVSTNIFLQERTTGVSKTDGKIERSTNKGNTNFNAIDFAFSGGLGVDYLLTEKMRLRAEPEYRRSLISIIEAPISGYLYSYGINLGFYYDIF